MDLNTLGGKLLNRRAFSESFGHVWVHPLGDEHACSAETQTLPPFGPPFFDVGHDVLGSDRGDVPDVLPIAIAIVSLSGLFASKDIRPNTSQNLPHHWHTCANEANVDLRRRPEHDIEVVECRVVRRRESYQGVQA